MLHYYTNWYINLHNRGYKTSNLCGTLKEEFDRLFAKLFTTGISEDVTWSTASLVIAHVDNLEVEQYPPSSGVEVYILWTQHLTKLNEQQIKLSNVPTILRFTSFSSTTWLDLHMETCILCCPWQIVKHNVCMFMLTTLFWLYNSCYDCLRLDIKDMIICVHLHPGSTGFCESGYHAAACQSTTPDVRQTWFDTIITKSILLVPLSSGPMVSTLNTCTCMCALCR